MNKKNEERIYRGFLMMNEIALQKSTKDKIIDYISYFFIYSFLGWIIETIYAILINGYFVKRGFLYGPICPIYGFGAAILIMSTKKLYGKPFKKFLIATIAFTVFEYFVSLILEMLFGLRWWDYTNDFLNIQGRVSLLYSIFWGLIGLFLLEKLHPFVEDLIQKMNVKISKNAQGFLVAIFIVTIIVDTVFSTIKYLR